MHIRLCTFSYELSNHNSGCTALIHYLLLFYEVRSVITRSGGMKLMMFNSKGSRWMQPLFYLIIIIIFY